MDKITLGEVAHFKIMGRRIHAKSLTEALVRAAFKSLAKAAVEATIKAKTLKYQLEQMEDQDEQ